MSKSNRRIRWAFELGLNLFHLESFRPPTTISEEKFPRAIAFASKRFHTLSIYHKALFETKINPPSFSSLDIFQEFIENITSQINEKIILMCNNKERAAYAIAKLIALSQASSFLPDLLPQLQSNRLIIRNLLIVIGLKEDEAIQLEEKIISSDRKLRDDGFNAISNLIVEGKESTSGDSPSILLPEDENLSDIASIVQREVKETLAEVLPKNMQGTTIIPETESYYYKLFKLECFEKNGLEFQRFFETIMQKANPDFVPISSGGGDKGSDGLLFHADTVYAVHAPEKSVSKKKLINKMNEDFLKAIDNWPSMKKWIFVYGQFKYPADIVQFSQQLEQKSKIVVELWNIDHLWVIAKNLNPTQMTELLGPFSGTGQG